MMFVPVINKSVQQKGDEKRHFAGRRKLFEMRECYNTAEKQPARKRKGKKVCSKVIKDHRKKMYGETFGRKVYSKGIKDRDKKCIARALKIGIKSV